MTQEQIYAELTKVFHDVFEDDTITLNREMTAADIPEWDSQSHITLILATEMHFDVKFRTAELDSLKNVEDFVALIQKKLA